MATGTTVDFTLSRLELVKASLRMLGNHFPGANDIAFATEALNILVRRVDDQGRWLFAVSNTESTLTLTSGTRTYTTGALAGNIATNILALEKFWLWDGVSYRPTRIISTEESLDTYYREGTGEPVLVYLERGLTAASNKLHTLPTPNATYTAKYTYRRRLYDFDLVTDNPDLPQFSLDYLKKGLAAELAPEYGKSLPEIQLFDARASQALTLMRGANAPSYDPTPVTTEYF